MDNRKESESSEQDDGRRASFFIGDQDGLPMKIVGPNDEEIPLDEVVVPPDGGWGWVIVFASFLSNLVVDGTVFSFGILLGPIHEASNGSIPISTIAWVGSLATGFYFLAGPVVSAISNKFGFRAVAIVGSITASLSLALAWLLCREKPVMLALFLLYGVLGGIGFGMIYVPAVIAVGFYFDNKRALATGIAICGSGIGTFLFPPIMNFVIQRYGWQGALIFQSGIILTCGIFGLLYRPLKPGKVMSDADRRKSIVSSVGSPLGTPLLQRIQKARQMEKWDSVNSFMNSTDALQDKVDVDSKSRADRLYNRARKSSLGPGGIPPKRGSVPSMLPLNGTDNQYLNPPQQNKGKSFVGLPLEDVAELAEEDHSEDHTREPTPAAPSILNQPTKPNILSVTSSPAAMVDGNENNNLLANRNSTFVLKIGSSMLEVDQMRQSRILRVGSRVSLSKPMFRDDIFYSGSLLRLPQYANNVNKVMSSAEWTAAISTVPPGVTDEEEAVHSASCCSPGILKKMLDFSLLVSPTFLLYSMSGFFTMLGLFVPFIYLKGVATESVGLDVGLATLLVSIIGIANTTGRVISGWIADRPEINVLFMNNASVTVMGVATAFVPYLNSFNALVGYACVFGLAMACFASLRSILLVELLGLEKLTNAFGLTLLFQGIASILGTPLAGFLYETTGSYTIPYWVAGGFILFSGIMCYPLNCVKRWEDNRNKNAQGSNSKA